VSNIDKRDYICITSNAIWLNFYPNLLYFKIDYQSDALLIEDEI